MNEGFFMGVDLELHLMIILVTLDLVLAQVQIGGAVEEGVCNILKKQIPRYKSTTLKALTPYHNQKKLKSTLSNPLTPTFLGFWN